MVFAIPADDVSETSLAVSIDDIASVRAQANSYAGLYRLQGLGLNSKLALQGSLPSLFMVSVAPANKALNAADFWYFPKKRGGTPI